MYKLVLAVSTVKGLSWQACRHSATNQLQQNYPGDRAQAWNCCVGHLACTEWTDSGCDAVCVREREKKRERGRTLSGKKREGDFTSLPNVIVHVGLDWTSKPARGGLMFEICVFWAGRVCLL